MTPRSFFRTFALAEAVTWTLLLLGMVLKHVTHTTELGVRVGGGLHGFVFLMYCLATVLVGVDARWGAGRILAGLGSSVVPWLTVPFERSVDRAGLLPDRWRLRRERGDGPLERVFSFVLRHPRACAMLAIGLVAGVFRALLRLGPPTQWFG